MEPVQRIGLQGGHHDLYLLQAAGSVNGVLDEEEATNATNILKTISKRSTIIEDLTSCANQTRRSFGGKEIIVSFTIIRIRYLIITIS